MRMSGRCDVVLLPDFCRDLSRLLLDLCSAPAAGGGEERSVSAGAGSGLAAERVISTSLPPRRHLIRRPIAFSSAWYCSPQRQRMDKVAIGPIYNLIVRQRQVSNTVWCARNCRMSHGLRPDCDTLDTEHRLSAVRRVAGSEAQQLVLERITMRRARVGRPVSRHASRPASDLLHACAEWHGRCTPRHVTTGCFRASAECPSAPVEAPFHSRSPTPAPSP